MGMFTSIMHEGEELQIKTGYDQCEYYKLGDVIPWTPDPYWPGSDIDGIHESYTLKGRGPWVIIQNSFVVAIEPVEMLYEDLAAKYDIQPPARYLWTEEQWAAKAQREADAEARYQKWCKDTRSDPTTAWPIYYLHCKLNEKSFAYQIFPATMV